jgi:hypothetical protein
MHPAQPEMRITADCKRPINSVIAANASRLFEHSGATMPGRGECARAVWLYSDLF